MKTTTLVFFIFFFVLVGAYLQPEPPPKSSQDGEIREDGRGRHHRLLKKKCPSGQIYVECEDVFNCFPSDSIVSCEDGQPVEDFDTAFNRTYRDLMQLKKEKDFDDFLQRFETRPNENENENESND